MIRSLVFFVLGLLVSELCAQKLDFKSVTLKNGQGVEYACLLPDGYDAANEYPILIALPPGQQNKAMVNAGVNLYWEPAVRNGWVMVSPVAPEGKFFTGKGAELVNDFLLAIEKEYKAEGGKYYLAGISNGGRSAFDVAMKYPKKFHAIMGVPGFATSTRGLSKLSDMPIALYVGAQDKTWVDRMKRMVEELETLGAKKLTFEIVPKQGHVIQGWQDGKKLFAVLNGWRQHVSESK